MGGPYAPYSQMQRLPIYKKYVQQLLDQGAAYQEKSSQGQAVRLKAQGVQVAFEDVVFGQVVKEVEDFVIMKSNGVPTYHLAVVVDDFLMRISHVVRGQDHLSNTAKHVFLCQALGFKPPIYAHYSLTHNLSKREDSQSIRTFAGRAICLRRF